jgi:hypothetical protein
VLTATVSVSLTLMLISIAGILISIKSKAPLPASGEVALSPHQGEQQPLPANSPPPGGEGVGSNPLAPDGVPLIPTLPAFPIVPLPNLVGLPEARADMTWGELDTWRRERTRVGYRLIYVNGYDIGGSPRYAALVIRDGKGGTLYTGCSLDFIQKKDAELRDKGYRPICVSGYLQDHSPKFAAAWVKDGVAAGEKIAFDLTEKEYTGRLNLEKKKGFMPITVTGYADGAGSYRFTALFVPAGKAVWEEQHDLTEEQYQKVFDQQSKSRGRPMTVTVYPTPVGLRFATVFVKDGAECLAPHGLSREQLQAEFNRVVGAGFWPISTTGYVENGAVRYAAVFVKNK